MDYQSDNIMAVITLDKYKDKISGGGVPFFFAENKEELERTSVLLARLTLGMVHDLENGVKIIIKH